MENKCILFDDWAVRSEAAFRNRKKVYFFCFACISFIIAVSVVGVFFELGLAVVFGISLAVLTSVTFEWLKVKYNHLIIRENQIEITNRFNRTTIYPINISGIFLELKRSLNRGGGIVMKFYNLKGNLICKYEDMLNEASFFGAEQSDWEKRITALGIQIKDPEQIFKNR